MTEACRQQLLHAIVDFRDGQFDPGHGLLRTSGDAGGAGCESLHYALALLETAERSRVGRAEAILHTVIDNLIRSLRHPSGIPDVAPATLADAGMMLLLVWHRHHRRLSTPLSRRLAETIPEIALRIRKKTSSARDLFVLLATGKLCPDDTLIRDALARLPDLRPKLRLTPFPADDFTENLIALHATENHVNHPETLAPVETLLVHAWEQITEYPDNPPAPPLPLPLAILRHRITFGATPLSLPTPLPVHHLPELLLSLVVSPRLPDAIPT
ncbi:MAG: hypothetical protein LBK99_19430 [Opitutaceae bacterium]|jgi:hypothetical protein|nr:hypothetical protein [Opitutaceae bacterium]